MKQYEYLVAYQMQREGYIGPCSGTSQIFRDKKIKSYEDIKDIQQYLMKQINGASNLGIYNFILLGRHKIKISVGKDIDH